jgi:hypothetical protein
LGVTGVRDGAEETGVGEGMRVVAVGWAGSEVGDAWEGGPPAEVVQTSTEPDTPVKRVP